MSKLRFFSVAVIGLAVASQLPLASHATAAEIRLMPSEKSISIAGEIQKGDHNKLRPLIVTAAGKRWLDRDEKPIAIHLDSPGGDVEEAVRLASEARLLLQDRLAVYVWKDKVCASACVMIFAAGATKYVEEGGQVIVHSAGSYRQEANGTKTGGQEDDSAKAATVAMARRLKLYKAPSSVIDMVVTTRHRDAHLLSPAELRAWNVEILPPE